MWQEDELGFDGVELEVSVALQAGARAPLVAGTGA